MHPSKPSHTDPPRSRRTESTSTAVPSTGQLTARTSASTRSQTPVGGAVLDTSVRSRHAQPRRLDFKEAPAGPSRFEQAVAVALAGAAGGTLTLGSLGVIVSAAISQQPDPDTARLDGLWGHYRAKAPRLSAEHLQDLAVTLGSHLLTTHTPAAAAMRQAIAELIDPVAPYLTGRQREALLAGLDRACAAMASLHETRQAELTEARALLAGAPLAERKSLPPSPPAASRPIDEAGPVRRSRTRRVASRPGTLADVVKRDPIDVMQRALVKGEPRINVGALNADRMTPEAFSQLSKRALLMVAMACNEEVDAAVARSTELEDEVQAQARFQQSHDTGVETKSGPVLRAPVVPDTRLASIDQSLQAEQQVAVDKAVGRMLRFYSWFVQGQSLAASAAPGPLTQPERAFLAAQIDALESVAPAAPPMDGRVLLKREYVPVAVALASALRQALTR